MNLILASNSWSRKRLLDEAGIPYQAVPANIDESLFKRTGKLSFVEIEDIAHEIACKKAEIISRQFPEDLVLGADQILIYENQIFDKPESLDGVFDRLKMLSGKPHTLLSATVFYRSGSLVASFLEPVSLKMRICSDAFLKDYIAYYGEDLTSSVAGYFFEGRGVQLFEEVSGAYHTILGLPILTILPFLRAEGVLKE